MAKNNVTIEVTADIRWYSDADLPGPPKTFTEKFHFRPDDLRLRRYTDTAGFVEHYVLPDLTAYTLFRQRLERKKYSAKIHSLKIIKQENL